MVGDNFSFSKLNSEFHKHSLIDEIVSTNAAWTILAQFIICLAQDQAYER